MKEGREADEEKETGKKKYDKMREKEENRRKMEVGKISHFTPSSCEVDSSGSG